MSYDVHVEHAQPHNIRDANNNAFRIHGAIRLTVQVESRTVSTRFWIAKGLSALVILGCDFCDKYIDSILPWKKLVALGDGTTVPIVRKLKTVSRPEHLPDGPRWNHMPRQHSYVRTYEEITIPRESQSPVRVTTEREGLLSIEQNP